MMCKWSSKSMAKPNEQSLWNDLNESEHIYCIFCKGIGQLSKQ